MGSGVCEGLHTLERWPCTAAEPLGVAWPLLVDLTSAGKLACLVACLPLLAVRLWIAMPGVRRDEAMRATRSR